MAIDTPKGMRLQIGLFGRRNVGKSSLLNAVTRQEVSIVSSQAGTTTDPVEKPMELLPVGPVLFVDTAGVDDEGALGDLRVKETFIFSTDERPQKVIPLKDEASKLKAVAPSNRRSNPTMVS